MIGVADDDVLVNWERYGFRGVMEKPWGIGTLVEVIAETMAA